MVKQALILKQTASRFTRQGIELSIIGVQSTHLKNAPLATLYITEIEKLILKMIKIWSKLYLSCRCIGIFWQKKNLIQPFSNPWAAYVILVNFCFLFINWEWKKTWTNFSPFNTKIFSFAICITGASVMNKLTSLINNYCLISPKMTLA